MFSILSNAVKMAHGSVLPKLYDGAVAVDGTVGNGHDTLFLARGVGSSGRVYGFDIQPEALHQTGQRLEEAGCSTQVTLIPAGHEYMDDYINEPVDVIMFNLGYLPGGDHGKITCAETTVKAVTAGLKLLRPGGIMSLVVYTGHAGAAEERAAVEGLVAGLDSGDFCVVRTEFVNRIKNPPYILLIEKNDASPERRKKIEEPKT